MNLAAARVVLRRRNLGEILDLALRWCFSADRRLYGRLAALVLLPALGLCLAARYVAQWEWPAVWCLAAALAMLGQGVFTLATGQALFSERVTSREVLTEFARRLPHYLATLVLSRLMLGLAAASVVLFPFVWVRLAFVHEASVLEGAGAIAAIRRASSFARFRFGDLIQVGPCLLLAVGLGTVVVEVLGQGLTEFVLQVGTPLGSLFDDGGSVFALIGFFAAIPYVAVARFLVYVDQRTRRDGWDIQVRFMALAAKHAQPGAGS